MPSFSTVLSNAGVVPHSRPEGYVQLSVHSQNCISYAVSVYLFIFGSFNFQLLTVCSVSNEGLVSKI
jgi:hypothetical protein